MRPPGTSRVTPEMTHNRKAVLCVQNMWQSLWLQLGTSKPPLERSPLDIGTVARPSVRRSPLSSIKEHALEKNPMQVMHVVKILVWTHSSFTTRYRTPGKDPIFARSVGKTSLRTYISPSYQRKIIHGRIAAKSSSRKPAQIHISGSTPRQKPHEWEKSCHKSSSWGRTSGTILKKNTMNVRDVGSLHLELKFYSPLENLSWREIFKYNCWSMYPLKAS